LGNEGLAVSSAVIGVLEPPPPPQETIVKRDAVSSNNAIRLGCFIIRLLCFFCYCSDYSVFRGEVQSLVGYLFA
jgi:hypothetical protein